MTTEEENNPSTLFSSEKVQGAAGEERFEKKILMKFDEMPGGRKEDRE